jgi:hypothetical protein
LLEEWHPERATQPRDDPEQRSAYDDLAEPAGAVASRQMLIKKLGYQCFVDALQA